MLTEHRGFQPTVDPSALVAPTAVLVGRVHVGPRSRIMYGAILDSEGSRVEVGECTIICENAVLRATASGDVEYPVVIGDHVFIAPHATLLGCTVEPCSYIAAGATVLQGATIHSGAAIAVGALVHAKTVVPSEFFVPPNTIAVGDPIKLYSPDEKEALANAIESVGFAKIAFGVEVQWGKRISRYEQATEARSKEFENHFGDVVLGCNGAA
ncbi:MAG: acyltransferase [Dehalococcoidia bacterium]|nr:MAG: acyltransferase [Dehalococcoidia bacterium]